MLHRSLTFKILVAVGLTVALVIAIYTYFVIRVQSVWWRERTQAQTLISASLVHEYLNGVMLSEHHEEVQGFLMQLKQSDEIRRGRVIKPDGGVVFSTDLNEIGRVKLPLPEGVFREGRVVSNEHVENGERLSRAIRPIARLESCRACHTAEQPWLGAIVIEKSLTPAEASIAENRNLLILFGAVIFILVGIVLWLLIMRLITQPVGSLLERMRQVQAGDFETRVPVESSDEIGELASGFNAMVQSLKTARQELQESHEKQIQQASKLASIGELAAGIAHEIRNPLAGIGSAAEVLAERSAADNQMAEVVTEIRQQVSRLNATLRDLLDFSRQRDPEIVPCDVRELCKPMLALIRPDAQKHRVEIIEEYAPDLTSLCGDPQQLQQALLNILLNAVQAMPDGGALTLRAEVIEKMLRPNHPKAVRISIQDTGEGVSPENLPKIFSPFFTTKHRGTGLGLAITRTIIENHRGNIVVQSERGKGATFILELPACNKQEGDGCPKI